MWSLIPKEIRTITNDFNNYSDLSLDGSGHNLVSGVE